MPTLSAKVRKILGRKVKSLRGKGIIPAILYGKKIKSLPLEIDLKSFKKIYQEVGKTSLIDLEIKGSEKEEKKKISVLIHEVDLDPLTGEVIHVDFYQPILTEEVEATVPLVFVGEAPAVKNLGGTLIKEIQELQVKALPQKIPHEIKVDISKLETFEDEILIKDLEIPEGVKIDREPEEIVAVITPPEDVEKELEEPIEEKVEEVKEVKEKETKEEEEEKKGQKEEQEKKKESS